MVGLEHPVDLDAWRRWEASRVPARRRLAGALAARRPSAPWLLHSGGGEWDVLVAVESASPTSRLALLDPIAHLGTDRVAVLSPIDLTAHLPEGTWTPRLVRPDGLPEAARTARSVVSTGHYLPVGAAAYDLARERGLRHWTVQHGLLTPLAPPLAADTTLAAFSDADARFWASGRTDVAHVAPGSQLLWRAGQVEASATTDRPVFLGQLHAAELDHDHVARISLDFCRETGASYRPHPGETDRRSRRLHEQWARLGVDIDPGTTPLRELAAPIVSLFSTGILEAAARGLPAWCYDPDAPHWLREFWDRYGMNQWGTSATAAPPKPGVEPALAIARAIANEQE